MEYIPTEHLRFAKRTYPNRGGGITRLMREEMYWCQNHYHFSARLAAMCYQLVDSFGRQTHWKDYTCLNEMKEHAMSKIKLRSTDYELERFKDPYRYFLEITNFAFRDYLKNRKQWKIENP